MDVADTGNDWSASSSIPHQRPIAVPHPLPPMPRARYLHRCHTWTSYSKVRPTIVPITTSRSIYYRPFHQREAVTDISISTVKILENESPVEHIFIFTVYATQHTQHISLHHPSTPHTSVTGTCIIYIPKHIQRIFLYILRNRTHACNRLVSLNHSHHRRSSNRHASSTI